MTTTTAAQTTTTDDIIRRGIKRELACKLTDEELLRIARQRVSKEAERDQLSDDLRREKKAREEQIDAVDSEVAKMGRELRTGEQDRTVSCNEVFRKAEDGTGWIFTIRTDTNAEVERRPANAHEVQRYLPGTDPNLPAGGSVIDIAAKRQANAEAGSSSTSSDEDDVPAMPDAAEGDDVEDGDDDSGEGKAKKRGGRKAR